MQAQRQRVAVLYTHSDFTPWNENVSANMISKIIESLSLKFDVSVIHFAGFTNEFARLLKRFEMVFNVCYGYDNLQQTDVCKWLDDNEIPHSASSHIAQLLAQDKLLLPQLCKQVGLNSPQIIEDAEVLCSNLPMIVKPRFGSMHRDIHVFKNGNVPLHYLQHNDYLVQDFIKGREFTAAIIPNETGDFEICLNPVEIVPDTNNEFFILGSGQPKQLCFKPELNLELLNEIKTKLLQLHKLIGLKGLSRTDFKVYNNTIFVLDVNAMPNLEPEKSFLPRICNFNGINYERLVKQITIFALKQNVVEQLEMSV
ncbi:MAG: ATP-grasp domain-containing protein [Bacteroidia bacterium]